MTVAVMTLRKRWPNLRHDFVFHDTEAAAHVQCADCASLMEERQLIGVC